MGYNISDVGGEATGGLNDWTATLDLSLSNATTVSGDFQVIALFGGADLGEATDGYDFSVTSGNPGGPVDNGGGVFTVTSDYGTLVYDEGDGTYTFTVDWDAVRASGNDQVFTFDVTGTSGADTDTDTVSIDLLICVARGTLIDTETGPLPVESLQLGQMVQTLDGGAQPVRWIGSRKVSTAEIQADPSLKPVLIAAGALGPGHPERDLLVSPQHRVVLQDWRAQLMFGDEQVLVPAKALINDISIRRDPSPDGVEYFHVLFDQHQIMFTEGLPTESFHPGNYALTSLAAPARAELFRLFPQLRSGLGYGVAARPSLRPWEARMLARPAAAAFA